ncbi:OmpA/MotB family protein [Succinimonas amylolytica]|uniref:OmpA/MotB family protein n=1 Tax=Succinimonas amylolytica TaxID=83769 RepID=UPI00036EE148|nr:OmpA family protein [Succinimonas amylolytica]
MLKPDYRGADDSGHADSADYSDGKNFWMSYTDIMTALLFIFIIIICSVMLLSMSSYRDKKELLEENSRLRARNEELYLEKRSLEARNHDLSQELSRYSEADNRLRSVMRRIYERLLAEGVMVTLDEANKTIHIDSNLMQFESAKYDIPERYRDTVRRISTVLTEELRSARVRGDIDTVFIEGHTDKNFYDNRALHGNWGLSALRAISFWEELLSSGRDLDSYTNSEGKRLFSVSGYAESRPAPCSVEGRKYRETAESGAVPESSCPGPLPSDTESDNMNRRIDIRFTPYHRELRARK